uniref:Uncharacterized protein n=1 Tax=Anguilla anguilla TaxID=7936 RepID=A0A0E9PS57_ANGAN
MIPVPQCENKQYILLPTQILHIMVRRPSSQDLQIVRAAHNTDLCVLA